MPSEQKIFTPKHLLPVPHVVNSLSWTGYQSWAGELVASEGCTKGE